MDTITIETIGSLIEEFQIKYSLTLNELGDSVSNAAHELGIEFIDIQSFWERYCLVWVNWQGRYIIVPRF